MKRKLGPKPKDTDDMVYIAWDDLTPYQLEQLGIWGRMQSGPGNPDYCPIPRNMVPPKHPPHTPSP
jgi:hypothetical protein